MTSKFVPCLAVALVVAALADHSAFAQASGLYSFDRYFITGPAAPSRPAVTAASSPSAPSQQSAAATHSNAAAASGKPIFDLGPDTRLIGALGIEYHKQDYKEPSRNASEKGSFLSGTAMLGVNHRNIVSRLEGRFGFGSIDYSDPGSIIGVRNRTFEGRAVAGYAFDFYKSMLMPYTGYGYRWLADYLAGKVSSNGGRGYDRFTEYHYLPIGVDARVPVSDAWYVRPNAEYDFFLGGTRTNKLAAENAAAADTENTLKTGYGLRGHVFVGKRFESGGSLDFGPYVRYWNIKSSDTKSVPVTTFIGGTTQVPETKTYEYGVTFVYRWE